MTDKTTEVEVLEQRNVPDAIDGQSALLNLIERLATNPDADVEKIQRIMDMQRQGFDREAEQVFNGSMCQAQNKIELVVAKKKNNQTNSFYADLKTILVQTKKIYTAEGFSLMFYEGVTEKQEHIRVCVDIMHEAGHTKKRYVDCAVQTTGIAGKAMMTLIHGEGSAFSYGRRYLTCMIFNIPTGDDDGNAAGGKVDHIDGKQLTAIKKLIKEKSADEKKFLVFMKAKTIEEIPTSDYEKAIEALEAKQKVERTPGQEG